MQSAKSAEESQKAGYAVVEKNRYSQIGTAVGVQGALMCVGVQTLSTGEAIGLMLNE